MNADAQEAVIGTADSTAPQRSLILTRLLPLFAVSGVAALMYQICWQRMLFVAFGVDVDSVTIIVSVFMLGLGVGALVGGHVADRYPNRTLTFFALIELGIGAFGVVSPQLIRAVGALTIHGSLFTIAVTNFLLLLFPTVMMGATLPILVSHVMRSYRNVGVSIGLLYFVNTLGAAVGAGATGFVLLYLFGLTPVIYLAATLNAAVAASVWLGLRSKDA